MKSLILESCKHAKSSVGDKLKVVQFHPVIRNSLDSITQNNKLRLAPTRCSLDSQYVHIRCSLSVKNTKKPGQRTSGWRQSRRSLDSHYVTNHTLTFREGVITQSRAKSPGAPQTSTLSLCLIEQLALWQGVHLLTVKDSVQCIRDSVVESFFSLILELHLRGRKSAGLFLSHTYSAKQCGWNKITQSKQWHTTRRVPPS